MATESPVDAITISNTGGSLRFDDQGVTIRYWFRTRQIGWAELRCFADGCVDDRQRGRWA